MASNTRTEILFSLLKGLIASILITLAGMVVLAFAVVFIPFSDGAVLLVNQVLEIVSIFVGVVLAVGVGGNRGFLMGAALGLVYMVLGYGLYCLLDGGLTPPVTMVGEFAMGALIGALSGAVAANIRPRTGAKRFGKRRA